MIIYFFFALIIEKKVKQIFEFKRKSKKIRSNALVACTIDYCIMYD